MTDNPRQFVSLDYSNADMYSGLTRQPSTATPLNLPLENLTNKKPSTNQSSLEQAYNRSEEVRRQSLFKEQQQAQQAAQLALREREIARNRASQASQLNPPEQATVSSRDYESKFKPPPATDAHQSAPSTSSPPPTIKNTAARASSLVEPTAHPSPVEVIEIIPPIAGAGVLAALPRALPQAAGRLAVPGIVGGIDFANRVIQGQSVQHAASSAIASQVGFVGGFAIGSAIGGPLLGYAVGAVGGLVAGAIVDSFFNAPPTTANIPATPINYPPFRGGQNVGVQYNAIDKGMNQSQIDNLTEKGQADSLLTFTGPILSMTVVAINPQHEIQVNGIFYAYYITRIVTPTETRDVPFFGGFVRWVNRFPGQPISGDPVAPAPSPDNLPYRYSASPIGDDNTIPSGSPATPGKRGKTRNVAPSLPSNNTSNGAPFFTGHGGLAPSYTPNPTQTPDNLGGLLPAYAPVKQSLPFAEPDNIPIARSFEILSPVGISQKQAGNSEQFPVATFPNSPEFPVANVRYDSQGNVLPTDINGNKPFGFSATPLEANPIRPNALSPSNPTTSRAQPIPDAQSSIPKVDSAPKTQTPTESAASKQAQINEETKKSFEDQIAKLTAIATRIAALTPAIQGIPDAIANSPTVRGANKQTTQDAVCEIAQPGKCLGKAMDDSADKINQNNNQNTANILDKINAGASAAELGLLNIINNKLGEQVPGGISKFMENIAKNTYVEKALSVLTFAIALHNALMLSNNLGQTLGGIINTVLGLIFPKGFDGTPLNINEILGKAAQEIIEDTIGEANYTKLTEEWAKANRIYQATANVFNSITNLSATIISGLEILGGTMGKIGNALKKWGVLGEKAYEWFNPQPNFHNKIFVFLENANNEANTIQNVVNVPISIGQAKSDLDSNISELQSNLKGDKNPDGTNKTPGVSTEENKPKKDEFDLGKTISKGLDAAFEDLFDAED